MLKFSSLNVKIIKMYQSWVASWGNENTKWEIMVDWCTGCFKLLAPFVCVCVYVRVMHSPSPGQNQWLLQQHMWTLLWQGKRWSPAKNLEKMESNEWPMEPWTTNKSMVDSHGCVWLSRGSHRCSGRKWLSITNKATSCSSLCSSFYYYKIDMLWFDTGIKLRWKMKIFYSYYIKTIVYLKTNAFGKVSNNHH